MGDDKYIMRAHPYTPKKLQFPVWVSEKLDGVPVDLRFNDTRCTGISRQGEDVVAPIEHLQKALSKSRVRKESGAHIVGELYIPNTPFKIISGYARRDTPDMDTRKLQLRVFDAWSEHDSTLTFHQRKQMAQEIVSRCNSPLEISMIPQVFIRTQDELNIFIEKFMAGNKRSEGLVIKNDSGTYDKSIRSWDFQKLKRKQSRDLEVIGFEEAISKEDGSGLGMVGRINVRFHDRANGGAGACDIGIGPGKMTHTERKLAWANARGWCKGDRICEAEFMPDDSYKAGMREAKFMRWRPDRSEGE